MGFLKMILLLLPELHYWHNAVGQLFLGIAVRVGAFQRILYARREG
jgi:hypothetical protein